MERQRDRQVMHGETNYMQPQHYTEYMTWYTPETEVDVQTVREELGSRAMELTVATEPLTEAATDVGTKDQCAAEFGDSSNTSMSIDESKERKQKGMDETTRQELLQMLENAKAKLIAACDAHNNWDENSTRYLEREYRRNKAKAPSRFGGFVATGFGSL